MCRMTDTGARWKREITIPLLGKPTARYLVCERDGEDRYTRVDYSVDTFVLRWLKPKYAIRIRSKRLRDCAEKEHGTNA